MVGGGIWHPQDTAAKSSEKAGIVSSDES